MKSQIKLVGIDVDRTMLTSDYRLLSEVITAIKRAHDSGMRVCFATARAPQALAPVVSQIGIDAPSFCLNGAWIGFLRGDGTAILQRSFALPRNAARAVIDESSALGLNPLWFTDSTIYALSGGPLVDRNYRATGTTVEITDFAASDEMDILKILLLESKERSSVNLVQKHHHVCFVKSGEDLVEVVAPTVSKKVALEQYAMSIGISQREVAMVGDSSNDLEAIKWAGVGIAMGNATEEVKGVADVTVGTNDSAGVCDAMNYLMGL